MVIEMERTLPLRQRDAWQTGTTGVIGLRVVALLTHTPSVSALCASTVHRQCIAGVAQGVRSLICFGCCLLILPVARSFAAVARSDSGASILAVNCGTVTFLATHKLLGRKKV